MFLLMFLKKITRCVITAGLGYENFGVVKLSHKLKKMGERKSKRDVIKCR